ncbi:hypothetical protein BC939DRAFT_463461 [Gamsiella multidivaricata]|uniref:uncharacterized protein n=1 Tax=Gamsiella multidivaricata TaxID=101098 RepID=UPI00221ECFAE|nr:uncharacterized protein BC939DRAFT_463461 [Gamsiella multidivaricata]KAI7818272.1 hypothetical protein BC939DRAFT_463461 [Gamsiella multidivaricata]
MYLGLCLVPLLIIFLAATFVVLELGHATQQLQPVPQLSTMHIAATSIYVRHPLSLVPSRTMNPCLALGMRKIGDVLLSILGPKTGTTPEC